MCGRFTLTTPAELVAEAFGLDAVPVLSPRVNVSPTEEVATVIEGEGGKRTLTLLKWGFEAGVGRPLINARAESLSSRPSFRDAFLAQRCLVPADGFYEWPQKGRPPVWIRRPDRGLFSFAGLFEKEKDGRPARCTLVTTAPTRFMAGIHDRMPVILPEEAYAPWLDRGLHDTKVLAPLLLPRESYALETMEAPRLGRDVH
jgi:putative SOS response-associated peptidase YedK